MEDDTARNEDQPMPRWVLAIVLVWAGGLVIFGLVMSGIWGGLLFAGVAYLSTPGIAAGIGAVETMISRRRR